MFFKVITTRNDDDVQSSRKIQRPAESQLDLDLQAQPASVDWLVMELLQETDEEQHAAVSTEVLMKTYLDIARKRGDVKLVGRPNGFLGVTNQLDHR